MTGVLINDVYPLSGAHGILKKEDVILAIDGVSIGNNGTGFVFVPLSKPFIDDSADMCECPTNEKARMSGEQIVIISKFLMNDTTKGYNHLKLSRVMKVNGVEVLNLRHLRQLVEECCAEQLSFDLENGNVIAVNCKSAQKKRLQASELASSAVA
ncbi:BnaA10g28640D [Brassica napus]|uniref:BnaA10g28640D protein n=1 Tax=Brassica napus TaxID=3708 RepID=A0A078K156_BRANA|nr:BnaA10g28640D [Brassica napus]